jgi:hypothetical protein
MANRSKWPPVYLAAVLAVAGALAMSEPHDDSPTYVDALPAATDTLPDLAGTWAGTWQDTVFMVSGDLSWVITQDGLDISASGTIDLTVLGMEAESGTATGTITSRSVGNTLDFTFEAATVGNGSGTITGGTASGTGTVIPPLGFGDFTFDGTVTGETMRGTFVFTTAAGAGKAILTKQSAIEPGSWGELKARYRNGGH